MIKGHRQRYYYDESIHSSKLALPEYYREDRADFGCLTKCLDDMSNTETELEQLEALNEFLDDFTKAVHKSSCKRIVYRFVFDLRADTYDVDAHYLMGELLKSLMKKDEETLKESVSAAIEATVSIYPEKYDTLEARNMLARKMRGFLDDFEITKDGLGRKWKEVLIILTNFLEEARNLPEITNDELVYKFVFNTISSLSYFLHRFEDNINVDTCQVQLELLLVNVSHYLAVENLDREFREVCGVTVILVRKALGKLIELFNCIERNPAEFSDKVLFNFIQGTFWNHSEKILIERKNKCRILRISATVLENLYDDFWGDSEKSYSVMHQIIEITKIIKDDLSDIHDWSRDEVQDLLKVFQISFKLAKGDLSQFYLKTPVGNILHFCMKQKREEFRDVEAEFYAYAQVEECSAKTRGYLISVFCEVYSSSCALQQFPTAISLLEQDFQSTKVCDLTCHGDSCTHHNPSMEALVELIQTTLQPKDQYRKCLKRLLYQCQTSAQGGWFRKQTKALLKKLITPNSDICTYIVEDTQKIPAEIVLFALNCIKKIPENLMKVPALREILLKALVAFDESTRVSATRVFQEISRENLDLIISLLKFGSVFQQKSLESKINWISLLNPVLARKKQSQEEKDIVHKFIGDFREELFEHFYAGGSFPRQRYALKILKDTWNVLSAYSWEVKHLDAVFSCFDSPFEYVKKLVTECFKKFPENVLEEWIGLRFGTPAEIRDKLKDMMISARPADSLQVAYQLVIFSRIATKLFPDSHCEHDTDNTLILLEWCLTILKEGIDNAKESILKASATNPLYGTILCIRYLLEDLPKSVQKKVSQYRIQETPRWRSFYERILVLCSEASQIVAPIVNNSSPEGFVPEDETIFRALDDQVTPQMVLLCGWRTIKEVSLLLGEICENTPQNANLISTHEIVKIGENLIEILLESKHRGAFEVSAVGFAKLCTRLHLSQNSEVNKLPKEWLHEFLDAVLCPEKRQSSARYVKLCVTRRSAGLPFLIQAILTSYDPLLLTVTIKRLLKESQKNTEGRIHCMNILRYIFRCSTLKTFNYAGDGLIIAIESFGSESWAERNSATLLFSALIVRIFGVCRSKGATEELAFENTWIFSEFFESYPPLYDFLYDELREANKKLVKLENAPQLYPIFLILERIPVLNGHWAVHRDSSKFIEEIKKIPAKCHDLRIRILAVKSLIVITDPTKYADCFNGLLRMEISENSNELHSRLLQVKEIFRRYAKKDVPFIHKNLDSLIEFHKLHSDDCLITCKVFMEILLKYLPKADNEKLKNIINDSSVDYLRDFLTRVKTIMLSRGPIIGRTALQSTYLLLKLTMAADCETVGDVLIECLNQECLVDINLMLITALNIILMLNGEQKQNIPEEIRSEILDSESEFVSSLSEEQKKLIIMRITSSDKDNFKRCAQSENPLVSSRAFLCLPLVGKRQMIASDVNSNLSNESISDCEKVSIIRNLLANLSTIDDIFQLRVEVLLEFCGSDRNDFTRVNIALLVAELLKMCSTDSRCVPQFILSLTRVILKLLRDDDADVRRIVCHAIQLFSMKLESTISSDFINFTDEVLIPCDSFALHTFLRTLIQFVIAKENLREILGRLVQLEEAEADQEIDDVADDEWRVFDTKEANLFGDRESTIRILRYFVSQLTDN
ncbi:thyroid adenoma-associated protein homolog [Phlebotomus argentipes]|uniref:thyroid adenoma-associated protein homolog n=1 Tax=Phlebotomus argentipes TaxID=94469 RepID=UPI0028933211|nr:thyroid adenoma-associated protein homolog [Phlebotomus argentipes]